jgi:hypothetical protein
VRFGQELEYGRGSSPSVELITHDGYGFRSIFLGDGGDANGIWNVSSYVGWYTGDSGSAVERRRTVVEIPLPPAISGHTVVVARFHLMLAGSIIPDNPFPATLQYVEGHLLRVPADVAGIDVTGLEYDDSANLAWARIGGKPDVDYESATLFLFDWKLEDHLHFGAVGAIQSNDNDPIEKIFDIRSAVEWGVNRAKTKIQILLTATFAKPDTNRARAIEISTGTNAPTKKHSYMEYSTVPARAFYGANPDAQKTINLADYKDAAVIDLAAHIDAGNPQAGGFGPTAITHLANTTPNELQRNVIVRGGSIAGTVRQPSGGRTLKYVEPFDTDTANLCQTGVARIVPMPSDLTKYEVYWLEDGDTVEVKLSTTAVGNPTNSAFASDATWRNPDAPTKNMFRVLARDWGATAIVGTEEWKVTILGDTTPATYDPAAPDRYFLAPHYGAYDDTVSGGRDFTIPWSTMWRKVSKARYEQLWTATYVASYGGEDRTHVRVRHAANFVVGQWLTISSSSETTVEHAQILHIYTGTDPDPDLRDTLVLNIQLEAVYNDKSYVCTGVLLGRLWSADRAFISATAPLGQGFVVADRVVRALSGTARLTSKFDGHSEVINFTRTSAQLSIAGGGVLANAYAAADLIDVQVDRDLQPYYKPFFAQLQPEDGADRGEQLALIRALSVEIL